MARPAMVAAARARCGAPNAPPRGDRSDGLRGPCRRARRSGAGRGCGPAPRAPSHGVSFVDDAGAGRDGVARMRLGGVAFGHRRGDAALRPGGRGAFADRRRRDDGHRTGELQRGEQAGKPPPTMTMSIPLKDWRSGRHALAMERQSFGFHRARRLHAPGPSPGGEEASGLRLIMRSTASAPARRSPDRSKPPPSGTPGCRGSSAA